MSENKTDPNYLDAEVQMSDHSIVIPADVKNDTVTKNIGARKRLPQFGKALRIESF